ncbi:DUF3995 domain-containing protein [Leptospira sp. WS92.C1]
MTVLAQIASGFSGLILLTLSLLHFYWVFGGSLGKTKTIPADPQGKLAFVPGKAVTALVGILLFTAALCPLCMRVENVLSIPKNVFQYGCYFLSLIFFLRAVGDFKFVGFFKKIKTTIFAQYDTRFYSPLCVFLSFLLFLSACS